MNSITNRYNFVKQIGKGSFSQIYLVEDVRKGKKYALKHITKKTYSTCQECQILQLLQKHPHKNLIGLKEIVEDDKDILIVLDYVQSGSLLNYINANNGNLSEKKVRKLFGGIIDGLQHLHEKLGVVHRDIKLENILVNEHEEPKIIDFNLSFFWSSDELQTKYCGTVVYCGPEIVSGIPYIGPAQDIWSLGVVLYFLLFNCFPFTSDQKDKRDKRKSIMKHIAACEYKFPTNKKVSAEALDLLRSIFQMDPEKRPTLNEIKKHPWFRVHLQDKDTVVVEEEAGEEIFAVIDWEVQQQQESQEKREKEVDEGKKAKRKSVIYSLKRVAQKFSLLKTN